MDAEGDGTWFSLYFCAARIARASATVIDGTRAISLTADGGVAPPKAAAIMGNRTAAAPTTAFQGRGMSGMDASTPRMDSAADRNCCPAVVPVVPLATAVAAAWASASQVCSCAHDTPPGSATPAP